ncbi:MAG: hypothetical protein K8T89_24685, partial [Planctomycetes bacterium]|nr:hypothetical protein [Planctomycetota bacterium]
MSKLLLIALMLSAADPKNAKEEPGIEFKHAASNFLVKYPPEWKSVPTELEEFQFVAGLKNRVFMVSGLESKTTTEELITLMKTDLFGQWEGVSIVSTKEMKLQNEKAIRIKIEGKFTGIPMTCYLITFTHQGIVYRLLGIAP